MTFFECVAVSLTVKCNLDGHGVQISHGPHKGRLLVQFYVR